MQSEQELRCDSPESLARLIKYFSQEFVKNKKTVTFKRTRAKTEYVKNKKKYDKLFEVCEKYHITVLDYIKYSILLNGSKTVDGILNVQNFVSYANFLKRKKQYSDIYKYYVKSANNIADMCIREGYKDTVDCLRHLIAEDRLGYEYFSGRISKYYLASIQNFKKIFEKTTGQTRDELYIIYDVADELNNDVQNTFKEFTGDIVKPISFTDKILNNKINNNNNNNNNN